VIYETPQPIIEQEIIFEEPIIEVMGETIIVEDPTLIIEDPPNIVEEIVPIIIEQPVIAKEVVEVVHVVPEKIEEYPIEITPISLPDPETFEHPIELP